MSDKVGRINQWSIRLMLASLFFTIIASYPALTRFIILSLRRYIRRRSQEKNNCCWSKFRPSMRWDCDRKEDGFMMQWALVSLQIEQQPLLASGTVVLSV